jgi:hypothetical protein
MERSQFKVRLQAMVSLWHHYAATTPPLWYHYAAVVTPLRRRFGTLSATCFDFNRTTTSWFADELRSYVLFASTTCGVCCGRVYRPQRCFIFRVIEPGIFGKV